MATLDNADWAGTIAAELLRHVARGYPDVDRSTKRRALLMAAAELRGRSRVAAGRQGWDDGLSPSARANPWQVEDD